MIGIAAGHTYIYLKIILPQSHGYNVLKTPKFIDYWVNEIIRRRNVGGGRVYNINDDRVNINRPGNAAAARDDGPNYRPFAGRGVRLGGNWNPYN